MSAPTVKPAVLKELLRQLNHELSAAHAYLALAAWCHDQNYKGFARYFSKQAAEEREHADKFINHLLDRQTLPTLGAIPEPLGTFKTLKEVALQAQSMERANTAGIHAAYEAAMSAGDYPAQILLQWFITEQVEEENWADEMVRRIERSDCPGSLADLDRHLDRYLAEKGFQANAGDEK